MPAPAICSVCRACGCLRRGVGCPQPTFYRACGPCDEEEDACSPRFTVPAGPATTRRMRAAHVLPCLRMPATKRRVPATHVLHGLWCLRRGGGCLQPTFRRACNPNYEEIKFKEKTRSRLIQTGSDFSLNLRWPRFMLLALLKSMTRQDEGKTKTRRRVQPQPL